MPVCSGQAAPPAPPSPGLVRDRRMSGACLRNQRLGLRLEKTERGSLAKTPRRKEELLGRGRWRSSVSRVRREFLGGWTKLDRGAPPAGLRRRALEERANRLRGSCHQTGACDGSL